MQLAQLHDVVLQLRTLLQKDDVELGSRRRPYRQVKDVAAPTRTSLHMQRVLLAHHESSCQLICCRTHRRWSGRQPRQALSFEGCMLHWATPCRDTRPGREAPGSRHGNQSADVVHCHVLLRRKIQIEDRIRATTDATFRFQPEGNQLTQNKFETDFFLTSAETKLRSFGKQSRTGFSSCRKQSAVANSLYMSSCL